MHRPRAWTTPCASTAIDDTTRSTRVHFLRLTAGYINGIVFRTYCLVLHCSRYLAVDLLGVLENKQIGNTSFIPRPNARLTWKRT